MRHKLRINSLNDAQAECDCLRWSLVRTGALTVEEIRAEYQKHLNADRNQARRERDQVRRDMGLVRVRGALGGIYWE
jgi:hypothetical protein